MSTRGVRNNNPGNIDYSPATKWVGQLPHVIGIESRFCRFADPEHGIRALAKVLLTYQKRGIDTVAAIIMRWAPTSENNTAAYIDHVAKKCGVESADRIVISDMLPYLVPAIIAHENAGYVYPTDMVERGITMALGK